MADGLDLLKLADEIFEKRPWLSALSVLIVTVIGWIVQGLYARTTAERAMQRAKRQSILDNIDDLVSDIVEKGQVYWSKGGNDDGCQLTMISLQTQLDRLQRRAKQLCGDPLSNNVADKFTMLRQAITGANATDSTRAAMPQDHPHMSHIRDCGANLLAAIRIEARKGVLKQGG